MTSKFVEIMTIGRLVGGAKTVQEVQLASKPAYQFRRAAGS